ncbi:MAG: DnaJ domain-containing protein [Synergistaceae bacterium]|jgi:hypothetical protein|nr:DnaJ domain-containing protein [Synergistaceae bacterium]
MASFKDYYFILGVPKTATQEEIGIAYRFSRDSMNTGSAGAFASDSDYQAAMLRDIDEAYECLSDQSRRRDYDLRLGADLPRPRLEQNNPAARAANAKESIEFCFAAMKKKKSRSLPTMGRFLSALVFVAGFGICAILGVSYFKTGKLTLSLDMPKAALTTQAPAAGTPPDADDAPEHLQPKTPAAGGRGYVRVYDIPYGGIVSATRGECRKDPSPDSPVLTSMPRNATVFVAKESKGADGETWYFVDCNAGKGWVRGKELKVYK